MRRNPTQARLDGVVYHGTSTEAAALGILREGIQPPTPKYGGALDPVGGAVYVTPDIRYGVIYALGGVYLGQRMPPDFVDKDRYGYVFVVPAEELGMIQPDEDSIGEMVTNRSPAWLVGLAEEELFNEYTEYPEDYDEDEDLRLLSLLDQGYIMAQAEAGRIIADALSDDEILDLIERGAHIAHFGPLQPSECWRIDKRRSQELLPDASNFFDIAEPC